MKQLNVCKQLMNSQQAELYQCIQAFSLDAADARLPFSQRLARNISHEAEILGAIPQSGSICIVVSNIIDIN